MVIYLNFIIVLFFSLLYYLKMSTILLLVVKENEKNNFFILFACKKQNVCEKCIENKNILHHFIYKPHNSHTQLSI